MSDLSTEKWTELNEKLLSEKEAAEAALKAHRSIGRNMMLIAALMVVIVVVVFIVFAANDFVVLFAATPGIALLVSIALFLRHGKLADHAQSDIDRISRDIRQWKKKKPV